MRKKGNKFLVFHTSEEQFALSIDNIITIEKLNYEPHTHIDKRIKKVKSYPDFIEGVFAYKTRIIPVVEFEYFISHQYMRRHNENKIIIIRGQEIDFGILVDDVKSIIELPTDKFIQLYQEYPLSMVEKKGEIYIVPDLEQMLKEKEIQKIFRDFKSSQLTTKKNEEL